MRIIISAIGKLKSGPEAALFEHYASRLPWKIQVKEFDIKKPLPLAQRRLQEAELLLAACTGADHLIALDEKGKDLGSHEFARHLQKQADSANHTLAFIIGGADGLDESIRKKAHLLLSFGRITWPHMLMRGLLAEQLYRAYSILNNHPYHRA
jgi:23S rRNA (pseudouridine1915-N3)-methyltransferase